MPEVFGFGDRDVQRLSRCVSDFEKNLGLARPKSAPDQTAQMAVIKLTEPLRPNDKAAGHICGAAVEDESDEATLVTKYETEVYAMSIPEGKQLNENRWILSISLGGKWIGLVPDGCWDDLTEDEE